MKNDTANTPIVLFPIFTENDAFMSDAMTESGGMLCDMIEVNNLLAAIEIAESKGIAIPKFKVDVVEDGYFGASLNVELNGPVANEFDELFNDVIDGTIDIINTRSVESSGITNINANLNYDAYTYDIATTVNLINKYS